jgi:hypothetical protein
MGVVKCLGSRSSITATGITHASIQKKPRGRVQIPLLLAGPDGTVMHNYVEAEDRRLGLGLLVSTRHLKR